MTFQEAAWRIDLGEYSTWLDAERVVANVYTRYRELDPTVPRLAPLQLLAIMATWDAEHQ